MNKQFSRGLQEESWDRREYNGSVVRNAQKRRGETRPARTVLDRMETTSGAACKEMCMDTVEEDLEKTTECG